MKSIIIFILIIFCQTQYSQKTDNFFAKLLLFDNWVKYTKFICDVRIFKILKLKPMDNNIKIIISILYQFFNQQKL